MTDFIFYNGQNLYFISKDWGGLQLQFFINLSKYLLLPIDAPTAAVFTMSRAFKVELDFFIFFIIRDFQEYPRRQKVMFRKW